LGLKHDTAFKQVHENNVFYKKKLLQTFTYVNKMLNLQFKFLLNGSKCDAHFPKHTKNILMKML